MKSDEPDLKLNLLTAYPYMTRSLIQILQSNQDRIRFVLDSGAFTAWKSGKEIKLEDYSRFLDGLPFNPWRYFTLDVIGDPQKSLRNYQNLLREGYTPIPIFTRGESISALDSYYETSDVVGIGGLVRTPRNKGFINGIMKHVGDRKVHWLGFTSLDYLKAYRPYMCDSSSWVGALMFASLKIYDKRGKFYSFSKADFKRRPPAEVINLLNEYEIDPALLAISSNWTNTGRGESPTEKIAYRSFVRFQRDITTNLGTHMFMAVASDMQAKLSLDAFNFWESKKK